MNWIENLYFKTQNYFYSVFRYNFILGTRTSFAPNTLPKATPFLHQVICFADNNIAQQPTDKLPKSFDQKWPSDDSADAKILNSFRWTADQKAGSKDRDFVENLKKIITNWNALYGTWHPVLWRSDILGERVGHLIRVHGLVCYDSPPKFQNDFYAALFRQAKYLQHVSEQKINNWQCFLTHWGRILSTFAFIELRKSRPHALTKLELDIERYILPDGGHPSRNPAISLLLLTILCDIRDLFIYFGEQPPNKLLSGIDRLVPFIKGFRHGDGGFALFNCNDARNSNLINKILDVSGVKARALKNARYTGFSRLRAGQSNVLFDTGATVNLYLRDGQQSSALAFEFSNGNNRLICNCGRRMGKPSLDWNRALESSAAHSTIILGDQNIGPIHNTSHNRNDYQGNRLVEATHDGYLKRFGVTIARSLYLDPSGHDLRGEDQIFGRSKTYFVTRFHVHPDVKILSTESGRSAILKPARGHTWKFECNFPLNLEQSVYFGDGILRRSTMIVLNGDLNAPKTKINWRLTAKKDS